MPDPIVGDFGQRIDLQIRQGATFGPVIVIVENPDTTPVNLTGATIKAQLRKNALDTVVIADFVCPLVDATAGKFSYGLNAAITAAIITGESPNDSLSQFTWDLEIHWADMVTVTPIYYGDVIVLREVTR